MWTDTFERYVGAAGRKSDAARIAEALIDPTSKSATLPRIASGYADLFGPFEAPGAHYPLSLLGSFARIDSGYLPHWVDFSRLRERLVRAGELPGNLPIARFDAAAADAIGLIGSLTYAAEWVSDVETTADLNSFTSVTAVRDANLRLGAEVRCRRMGQVGGDLHILDVGVGRGNTIVPVLDQLPGGDDTSAVAVSLLDISSDAIAQTSLRLRHSDDGPPAARFSRPRSPVDVAEGIVCNLVELDAVVSPRTSAYDVVVSGGALFHSTDKARIFRWIYQSLRPGGLLVLWDWFAPCWAAPALVVGEESRYLDAGLYQLTAAEATAVEQTWLDGWIGEQGYFNYRDEIFRDLRLDLEQRLRGMHLGEPFGFVDWLKDVAERYPRPATPGHYLCIEGYTSISVYAEAMANAGFDRLEAFPLQPLSTPRERDATDPSYSGTIHFLVATR